MSDYIGTEGILAAREQGWDALLREFAKPIHPALIKVKPTQGKPEFVEHHTLRQFLHVAFDYTTIKTERVEHRGDGEVSLYCALTCRLGDDERTFHGWGESENKKAPFKSAESDAFRRICGMDLCLGLALWAREHDIIGAANKPASDDPSEAAPADTPPEPAGASTSVSEPTEDGGGEDGEASPPPTTNARSAMQRAFHAILGEMDLVYETEPESLPTDVKNWMIGRYGNSLSGITDEELRTLVGSLSSDNPKHAKNRARFAKVVSA